MPDLLGAAPVSTGDRALITQAASLLTQAAGTADGYASTIAAVPISRDAPSQAFGQLGEDYLMAQGAVRNAVAGAATALSGIADPDLNARASAVLSAGTQATQAGLSRVLQGSAAAGFDPSSYPQVTRYQSAAVGLLHGAAGTLTTFAGSVNALAPAG